MIQRKRAEGNLREALEKEKELTELKSRFITLTSHEFRTPLTTIQSSAELLEHYSHKWAQEKKLAHLHRIQASVAHMTKLLSDVLIIGKADAGKLKFNPLPLNLENFCWELTEELQLNDPEGHAIILICDRSLGDGALGMGHGEYFSQLQTCLDGELLRQILENLLSNAMKYSPSDRPIELSFRYNPVALENKEAQVVFQIRDRGIGIPPEDKHRLFEAFHRAQNVGTIAGTGLGLAIVKKCVEIHQGQIAIDSEVGVGTTVTVTLPILAQGYGET
jgi:signal transduction histidine kinase